MLFIYCLVANRPILFGLEKTEHYLFWIFLFIESNTSTHPDKGSGTPSKFNILAGILILGIDADVPLET